MGSSSCLFRDISWGAVYPICVCQAVLKYASPTSEIRLHFQASSAPMMGVAPAWTLELTSFSLTNASIVAPLPPSFFSFGFP